MEQNKLKKTPYCAAYGCRNSKYKVNCREKSFFRFPLKKKAILKAWLHNMYRDDFKPSAYSVLCSEHFNEECFRYENFTNRRLLKENAIPTIFSFKKPVKTRRELTRQVPVEEVTITEHPDVSHESSAGITTASIGCQTESFSEIIDELYKLRKENKKLEEEVKKREFKPCNVVTDCQMRAITGFSKDRFKEAYEFFNLEDNFLQNVSLLPETQFFLFLVKLRTGITIEFLSILFNISDSTVSRYFTHTVQILYAKFKLLDIWPSRAQVTENMPQNVLKRYSNCRIIIDCTEFRIQQPQNPREQQQTFSNYKNHNTLKALIGISPAGDITFISNLYTGSISDKDLFLRSKLLEKLEEGDMVMADKGFRIEKELEAKKCFLLTPTFLKNKIQFPAAERETNTAVSNTRVHVERAISKIKYFKYFEGDLPYTSLYNSNEVFFIACMLVNFTSPLIDC